MAFMAAAAPYLMAAQAVMGAISSINQGQAAAGADEFNATVARQNAHLAKDQAQQSLAQQQRDSYKKLSAIKAGAGASGIASDGSPMDVLSDSYTQSELDANTIIYNGKIRANSYRNQASLDDAKAVNDENAGYLNAAGKLLGGATSTYKAFDTVGTGA